MYDVCTKTAFKFFLKGLSKGFFFPSICDQGQIEGRAKWPPAQEPPQSGDPWIRLYMVNVNNRENS